LTYPSNTLLFAADLGEDGDLLMDDDDEEAALMMAEHQQLMDAGMPLHGDMGYNMVGGDSVFIETRFFRVCSACMQDQACHTIVVTLMMAAAAAAAH
jgi:hypothetical protein